MPVDLSKHDPNCYNDYELCDGSHIILDSLVAKMMKEITACKEASEMDPKQPCVVCRTFQKMIEDIK